MSEQHDDGSKEGLTIPYSIHKEMVRHLETNNKRWFVAFLVVLTMLFLTNLAWVIYENQFQDITIEQAGDTDNGGSNYFNGTGQLTLNESDQTETSQE